VLEIWVKGHSTTLKTAQFDTLHTISDLHSIVTMAVSGISLSYLIQQDTGWKSHFFHTPPVCNAPLKFKAESHRNFAIFGIEKLEWWRYQKVKKVCDTFNHFHAIRERYRDIVP